MSLDTCDYVVSLADSCVFFSFTLPCNFVELRQLLCFPWSFAFIRLPFVNYYVYCFPFIMIIDCLHCVSSVVCILCNCTEFVCIVFVMYRFVSMSLQCAYCVFVLHLSSLQLLGVVFVQLLYLSACVCTLSPVLVYFSCSSYSYEKLRPTYLFMHKKYYSILFARLLPSTLLSLVISRKNRD